MDERTGWLTALAALLGPIGVLIGRWWDRRDSKDKVQIDWREKRENSLFDRQDQQLERAYKRITELEEAERRLEADRDRGWSLARAWFDKAHEVNNLHRNCLNGLSLELRSEWFAKHMYLPTFQNIDTTKESSRDAG